MEDGILTGVSGDVRDVILVVLGWALGVLTFLAWDTVRGLMGDD